MHAISERPAFRVSVAPMMDWTDRHCRSFHRLLSKEAWLYTEMVTAQAVAHGNPEHLLGRGEEGGRVVLQLGGNDPALLAAAARQGEAFGYDEINLNCGCPSDRVKEGAFGACLMAEPARVADCVAAMQAAVKIPVTVKHRVGIDRHEDYGFVQRFVRLVAEAGCRRFIVHARNAWLDGLSPKENREIPPLRYEMVHQLRAEFAGCVFELNGGLQDLAQGMQTAGFRGMADAQWPVVGSGASPGAAQRMAGADFPGAGQAGGVSENIARADWRDPVQTGGAHDGCGSRLDGIMYGRRAYHDPWLLAGVDGLLATMEGGMVPASVTAGCSGQTITRRQVVEGLVAYLTRGAAHGVRLRFLARHVLGLYQGQPGARLWRRQLSDPAALDRNDPGWLLRVCDQVEAEAVRLRAMSDEFRQVSRG